MGKVTMTCLSPAYVGTSWTLDFSDENVVVVNPQNQAEIVFSADEAFRRIRFSGSGDYGSKLQVLDEDSQEYAFELEPGKVRFVKAFVEACVARDPERAIRHFQGQASRCLWIALVCLPAGILAGLLTFTLAPDRWPLYFASVLFVISGMAYLRWGLQDRERAGRIARMVKCLPTQTGSQSGTWSPWLIALLTVGLAGNLVLAVVLLRYLSANR